MGRALLLVFCTLALAGCATRGARPSSAGNPGPAEAGPSATNPAPSQVVGRVIAVDAGTASVIVQLAPYATFSSALSGRTLIARRDDLEPTARLLASPYLRGRVLGTRLLEGRPETGDEVVLPGTAR